MHIKNGIISTLFILVLIAAIITPVAADTELTPNETLDDEQILGHENPLYEPITYVVQLIPGSWMVLIPSVSPHIFPIITVAYDSYFQDIIVNRTGLSFAQFELGDSDTIYLRIEDGTNYGNTSGSYSIGVFDEDNIPTIGNAVSSSPKPNLVVVPAVFGTLLVILVLVRMYKKSSSALS